MKPIFLSLCLAAASLACVTLGLGPTPEATEPPDVPTPQPTAPPARPTPQAEAPADFAAEYTWQEAALAPPYYYQYTIRLGPGPQGEIEFLPGYPGDDTPVWTEPFDLAEGDLSALYKLMVEAGVFTREWREEEPPPGSDSEGLEVTAGGEVTSIPGLAEEDKQAIGPVYAAMHDLVPEEIWDTLNAQHEEYKQAHPDG